MQIYKTVKIFFEKDQFDRQTMRKQTSTSKRIDLIKKIKERDHKRLFSIKKIFQDYPRLSKKTLFYAGIILQHSKTLEDHRLAAKLAKKSYKLGYRPAQKLYQAAVDRILLKTIGKQKYGTHFKEVKGKKIFLPSNKKLADPLISND